MSQTISRYCQPDTLPVMVALSRFVDANVSLFSPIDLADRQGASTSASYVLLVELPNMPLWRNIMTAMVPLLQAFVASITVAGKVASTNATDTRGSVVMAGRSYDFGTTILFEAFRLLHPQADHAMFYHALLKERGVL